jgi:D-serine deaminase-like pyridoxal phosphate-dependent protein
MVDCGYHRDGVDPEDPESVVLAARIDKCPHTQLGGIYTHGGHSYNCRDTAAVMKIGGEERDCVVEFAAKLREAGVKSALESSFSVGVGSTPTCSQPPEHLNGVTEMHPGNFLCYDRMQQEIGSCTEDQIAGRVLTRVVGHYPKQNMILVDLGWTGCTQQGRDCSLGQYGGFPDSPDLQLNVLKQEAGEIESKDGSPIDFTKYPIGTILKLAPYHACAAGAMHSKAYATDGDTVVGIWESCSGW